MKSNKKQGLILSILGILSLILITVGVSFSFFNYAKEGTTDSTITTGTITFLYTEVSGVGRGISIEDAYPVSDSIGKVQTGEGKVFDFKVTSNTPTTSSISYEVTARKKDTSTVPEDAVKLYLTKAEGTTEEKVILSKYSELTPTTKVDSSRFNEKTLYQGKVPANTTNFEQAFRLRMWIDEKVDFSDGSMNDKEFTVTVNVYANAKVVTDEQIELESSTKINTLSINNAELPLVEGKDYNYETTLPEGTTSTEITVETENPNATVEIEKIDSLAYSNKINIKRLSVTKELELSSGDNYFNIKVTSENKKFNKEYILKINTGIEFNNDSLLGYFSSTDFENDTVTNITVNNYTYSAHVYNYDGDQVWNSNMTFGNANDVATASAYAKNMVVVKVNGDLTINSGVKVTTYNTKYGGPKGFLLFVSGTLTNNGEISMTARGAKAVGENVYLWKNEDGSYEYVPAVGAKGGDAIRLSGTNKSSGDNGDDATGRQTGGGGSGSNGIQNASTGTRVSGAGTAGTSYSGGTGGAPISGNVTGTVSPATGYGGAGGNATVDSNYSGYIMGGGAGNPGGKGKYYNVYDSRFDGSNGTGGLLIMFGNNIYNNGTISSEGSRGGGVQSSLLVKGGAGSGGGSVNIFYRNIYQTKNPINVDGGQCGLQYSGYQVYSGTGGRGSVTTTKIK